MTVPMTAPKPRLLAICCAFCLLLPPISLLASKAVVPLLLITAALARNLANFTRMLALPKEVEHWSLTRLREKLVKIGAEIARHGRYVTFQLSEVAVPGNLFREIMRRADELRRRPAPA